MSFVLDENLMDHRIADRQRELNSKTQQSWDLFENHRDQVTQIIIGGLQTLEPANENPTLCVLGAGNGNDLDVAQLAKHFASIHVLDIDRSALDRLWQRYDDQPEIQKKIQLVSGVEFSGITSSLVELGERPTEANVKSTYDQSLRVHYSADEKFDVVVSTCLLTQLIDAVVQTLGHENEWVIPLTIGIRDGHLNLMASLCKAGGRRVLVTDFVSSDTMPELASADDPESVLALARHAIDSRNFFTGANAFSIREKLVELQHVTNHDAVEIVPPWRWQIGQRYYLVTAVSY